MDTSVSRVFCFGLWRRLPLKLLEQSSAFLLFCSGHRPVGHVPHGQWARLGADILALIDPSACLVDPCTCEWHTKCAPHGPLTVSVVRPRREVFLRLTVVAPALSLSLRDLDLLLKDLLLSLHSFSTNLDDL